MNIGIICEFNPFHKGHKYLIDSVKKDGDCIICAMSGNFVQRGDCAVYGKFDRAKAALQNGADLVLELPAELSTLSARGFARAGVSLLESAGVCDVLAFGAEENDIEKLKKTADEIKEKDFLIKEELKRGLSYPDARRKAVGSPLLDFPNNILALEYLSCTSLKPVTVKRIGLGHDSADPEYSAGEIRKTLDENETASLKNAERAVLYKLRTMTPGDFLMIDDVSEGLENRIASAAKEAASLDELYDMIKTKRYTMSRIKRIVLRSFLGIDKSAPKYPEYIRPLGFTGRGKKLLSQIKKEASLPLIAKYSDAKSAGGRVLEAFERECKYTDIYGLCFKTPKHCGLDKTAKLIEI